MPLAWIWRAIRYLPLVISIIRDIVQLSHDVQTMREAKFALKEAKGGNTDPLKGLVEAIKVKNGD